MTDSSCPLCASAGGTLVWQGTHLRVIRADEAGFPAFYRVVWQGHVAEFSDLSPAERQHCMDAVVVVESALREFLQPTKINLAALGNVTNEINGLHHSGQGDGAVVVRLGHGVGVFSSEDWFLS